MNNLKNETIEKLEPQDQIDVELEINEAIQEAKRCLQCKNPQCKQGCPIGNDIPDFVGAVAKGNIGEALSIISKKSNLPAVCGRVCPKELQCEGHCVLNKKGKPVAIGSIERFIADFGFAMDLDLDKLPQKTRGKVAVIGSGPAGLTVAGDLAKQGFHVTVFEIEHEPGGVLLYGIPSFRLPKDIVRRETKRIQDLGVNFVTNCKVGPDITIDDMFAKDFDAIFMGTGTSIGSELDLPNKHLHGIIQANYLLHSILLLQNNQIQREDVPLQPGDEVIVIGGGNVAMDAARTALREGAKNVTVVYHRTEDKMSALKSEYDETVAEGAKFMFESNTLEYLPHANGKRISGVIMSTPEGNKMIPADRVFLAVGSRPANRIVSTTDGIDVDERGYVITRERPYGMTTRKAVFAGGDVVHQPATVVLAMKEAKKVAEGIASYVDAMKLLDL